MLNDFKARKRSSARLTPLGELAERRNYVNAPRTWTPGELVTASMMNTIRDLFLEIEAGTADHQKATFTGRTSAALATDLSSSGKASIAYDTTLASLVASLNGGSYVPFGGSGFDPFNPLFIAWGID